MFRKLCAARKTLCFAVWFVFVKEKERTDPLKKAHERVLIIKKPPTNACESISHLTAPFLTHVIILFTGLRFHKSHNPTAFISIRLDTIHYQQFILFCSPPLCLFLSLLIFMADLSTLCCTWTGLFSSTQVSVISCSSYSIHSVFRHTSFEHLVFACAHVRVGESVGVVMWKIGLALAMTFYRRHVAEVHGVKLSNHS